MWKWLDSLGDFAMTNIRVVKSAWAAFAAWCIIACVAIWWVEGEVYGDRLDNDQSSISTLSTQLSSARDEAQDLRAQLASRPDRPDRWAESYPTVPIEQVAGLVSRLRPLMSPGQIVAIGYVDNPSAVSLSQQFATAFRGIGAQSEASMNPSDDPKEHGLTLYIHHPIGLRPDGQQFVDAFRLSGFSVEAKYLEGDLASSPMVFGLQVSYPP